MASHSCQVKHCRFPHSHTTAGHRCGICGKFGHGQIECNNPGLKAKLQQYHNDKLQCVSDYCQLEGCRHPWSHKTIAHHCGRCNRNHHSSKCIIQPLQTQIARFYDLTSIDKYERFFERNPNGYVISYVGMGCDMYIKLVEGKLMGLFMHHDSWGQYGAEADDTPVLEKFIGSSTNLTESFKDTGSSIQCPICRKEQKVSEILEIKGSSEKCCVCLDADVEVYFPNCKHANLCKVCLDEIKK